MSDTEQPPEQTAGLQHTTTTGKAKPTHSDLYSQTSVIIPTIDSANPHTVASLPDGIDTHVVREGNRAEARNIGATEATTDILVFCDDDIEFDLRWFSSQLRNLSDNQIIGLADYGLGYLLTRFMAMTRSTFQKLGGFDEKLNHMEDTEFCLRAKKEGVLLTKLPQDSVVHIPHENSVTTADRINSLSYIARKHKLHSLPALYRVV